MRQLSKDLVISAEKTIRFFESNMLPNGSYGENVIDISCYYKSPMMFLLADKIDKAMQILDYTKTNFMRVDGDFLSVDSTKSINSAYSEFWTYTNGWLVRAAQQLGREDITKPAFMFLDRFKSPLNGGFLTHKLSIADGTTDVLTTSHQGLICLERGDIVTAVQAGRYLCYMIEFQPSLSNGFYLRLDREGNVITEFEEQKSPIYWINRELPNQFYFMIGYLIAYLGLLFQSTHKVEFFTAAYRYVDFVLSCHEDVFSSYFSHKLAWACSVLFSISPDKKLESLIRAVMKHFLASQSEEGMWFLDKDVNMSYDQSVEIACWFLETAKNVEIGLKKKKSLLA